jgi:probable F420-dependent oxidoreductase
MTTPDDGREELKVRIGFGLGTRTDLHDPRFGHVVDELERLGFDSLWVSERIGGDAPDPLVAMSYAAGRTTNLKFGMGVMVLPGRNPIVLAKALASLSTMSDGRLLPAFGLGLVHPLEQQAFGVERSERAAWFNESMAVMRQCWTGAPVVHDGPRFHYDGVKVRPVPKRMDVWLGGFAPSELKRVGRLADGWLPSFVTPADAAAGRQVIERVCAEHEREIEHDHYGVLIPYSLTGVPDAVLAQLAVRRPDLDPTTLVPTSWEELTRLIRQFIDVGTSKFVVLPLAEPHAPEDWTTHLDEVADAVLPLET